MTDRESYRHAAFFIHCRWRHAFNRSAKTEGLRLLERVWEHLRRRGEEQS